MNYRDMKKRLKHSINVTLMIIKIIRFLFSTKDCVIINYQSIIKHGSIINKHLYWILNVNMSIII